MTTIFDPDQSLRSANPVDEARLPQPWESVAAHRMFEKITGIAYAPARQPAPSRRRHWRVYVGGLSAAVALGCGVAYAVIVSQPSVRQVVACYAQPQLAGRVISLTSNGPDAVAQCREAWAKGHVGPGPAPADLVACVLRSGPVGVFPRAQPSDDVCRRLGLARYARPLSGPSPASYAERVTAMRDAVVAGLSQCLKGPDAVALVRQALRQEGLGDWTVTIAAPFSPDRPCASPGFDEPGHRVMIIPNTTG